jgi:hypothetical protein
LGTGLRAETASILLDHHESNGFVMAGTYAHGEENFPSLPGWFRVLGAPSLENLEQRAQKAEQSGLVYEAIGYGLETGKSTPEDEWQNIIDSTLKAREIADQYNKLLAMGPGFKLMSENEEKYPEMASLSDIWILQTQRLQVHPPGPKYRQEVERIVDLIRSGNPDIIIWGQIVLPPDREPDHDYWLAYYESIKDIVDVTYIGAYTWNKIDDPSKLIDTIDLIFAQVCYPR